MAACVPLPSFCFSIILLVIIPPESKFISDRAYVLQTTYFRGKEVNEKFIITIKLVIYPILFLSLKRLKNIRFVDIWKHLATFTLTLFRTNFSLKRVNRRPYEITFQVSEGNKWGWWKHFLKMLVCIFLSPRTNF